MSLEKEMAKQSHKYAQMSEDQLLTELGRRLDTLSHEQKVQLTLSTSDVAMPIPEQALAGPLADKFKEIAMSFLDRFHKDLYRLMCDTNDADNQKIRDAFSTGEESAAIFVSSLVLVHFAWLPAIATIVIGLIIRRFVKSLATSTYDQACAAWGKELGIQS